MEKTVGKQSIRFEEAVHLISAASIAGKKEGEGPLGCFVQLSASRIVRRTSVDAADPVCCYFEAPLCSLRAVPRVLSYPHSLSRCFYPW